MLCGHIPLSPGTVELPEKGVDLRMQISVRMADGVEFIFQKTYPLIIISQCEIGEPLPEDSVLFPLIIPQYLQLSELFKSRKILRSVEIGIADDRYCRQNIFLVLMTSQNSTA